MPVELVPYISAEQFHYLSGLAGIASAFVILVIWSQGL
jgi:hypothetical protein